MITFSFTDSVETDDAGNAIVYPQAVGVLAIGDAGFSRGRSFTPNVNPKLPGTFTDSATLTFFIYKSVGRYRRGKGVVARKDYSVSAEEFDTYFGRTALRSVATPAQGGSNDPIEFQCERFALDTLDTNGKSFFDGGVQS